MHAGHAVPVILVSEEFTAVAEMPLVESELLDLDVPLEPDQPMSRDER